MQQYEVASMALKSRLAPKITELPKQRGVWLRGPAGIGKTTTAIK